MPTTIPQVANTTSIRSAEFVRMSISSNNTSTVDVYTFSSSYRAETLWEEFVVGTDAPTGNWATTEPLSPGFGVYWSSGTFTCLGGLMAVGDQHRDLRATSYDTSITVTGMDPAGYSSHEDPGGANTTMSNIALVLSTPIRGSDIEIFRGFYNSNYEMVNFVPRFKGIVTGYTISEDIQDGTDIFAVTVNCSSYKRVLENNIGGRRTNSNEWAIYDDTDTSMNNIEKLSGALFDFGKKV
jgi:hypothetical protein